MEQQILEIDVADWHASAADGAWIAALEAGKVLYFPRLAFELTTDEHALLTPDVCDPKVRQVNLAANGNITGAVEGAPMLATMATMIGRYRDQAQSLIQTMLPRYASELRTGSSAFWPLRVETRPESWRTDDRRLHIDASISQPTYGERILRVYANVNQENVPLVWRLGEPFEVVARQFLPRVKKYSSKRAKMLQALRVTKTLRSEYDHVMLQLHDQMKSDLDYQQDAHQITVSFAPGSVWMCFSDQTSHAVMSGQYVLEQTLHLPVAQQYDPGASPLALLARLTGRALV